MGKKQVLSVRRDGARLVLEIVIDSCEDCPWVWYVPVDEDGGYYTCNFDDLYKEIRITNMRFRQNWCPLEKIASN